MADDRRGDNPAKAGTDRESRLEVRLRDNLRRRKEQVRARGVPPSREAASPTPSSGSSPAEPGSEDGA